MKRSPAPFLLALLLANAPVLFPQSYLVRTYNETDGLSSSVVYDLAQDRLGRIWFATRAGISVYDGSDWVSYVRGRDLPSTNVIKLTIDGNGTVWAWAETTEEVLLLFSGEKWGHFPRPAFVPGIIRPTAIEVSGPPGAETVVLGTPRSGLLLHSPTGWKHIDESGGLPSGVVSGLARAGSRLYVATAKGLGVLEAGTIRPDLAPQAPELRDGIYGIGVETTALGSRIWLVGKSWLGTLSWEGFKVLSRNVAPRLDSSYPNLVVAADSLGGAYFGNPNAVFHFPSTGGIPEKLGKDAGLIAEGGSAFLLDREKNLWIAGLRGVNKITSRRFANFHKAQGLLEDEVTALARWNGQIAFGHNLGLSFYDGTEIVTMKLIARSGGTDVVPRVLDLAVDGQGRLWAAVSMRGLLRISPGWTTRWFGPESGFVGSSFSAAAGPDGRIWASDGKSVFVMTENGAVRVFPGMGENNYVRKITFDSRGAMMLATLNGLFLRQGSSFARFVHPDDRNANNVFAAIRDEGGRILVGTMAGLFEAADGVLRPFAPAGLKIERPVYLILRDAKGRLWFGTDNGAVRWDGKEAREYSVKAGFAGQEVNRSAGLLDDSGRVWIGTNLGASRYEEAFDFGPPEIPPPLVRITSIEAGGTLYPIDRPLRLPFSRNILEFSFRAVSLLEEGSLRYRFFLEGFDSAWVQERRGAADQFRYTNLPPGDYRLRLQAKTALGRWSDPIASAEITILKPITRQWWFYLLAGAFLLVLAFAVFEIISEKRLALRLEKEVRERTAEIQASLEEKDILLREIHHRVKNNLQVVSSLLYLQSQKTKGGPTTGLFRESMSRIRAMALIHENLYRSEHLGHIDIAEYLQRLCADLLSTYAIRPGRVAVDIRAADLHLSMETAITCGLILNELISNALKHAFPEEKTGTIRIEFGAENGRAADKEAPRAYTLVVADDGVGMPAGFETEHFGSLGLRLIRSLTGQLGGTLAVENAGGAKFAVRFRT